MTYTLHHELSDGTLDKSFHSVSSKKLAVSICRKAAASKPFGISNFVICRDDMTVEVIKVRPLGVDE